MPTMCGANLPGLPEEILLHILSFLEPTDITRLQAVSRRFCSLFRDNVYWRSKCLQDSSFLEAFNRRKTAILNAGHFPPVPRPLGKKDAPAPPRRKRAGSFLPGGLEKDTAEKKERARILANWDPSYQGEQVSWYDEYIQRHGRITVGWFQLPRIREQGTSVSEPIEARGVALYRPDDPLSDGGFQPSGPRGALFAVSPLDDGSVCLWDVNGSKGRRGAIHAKSPSGILFIDGPGGDNDRRSKRVDSGVTECVAVDSHRNRAFVAVQSHLLEIDLERLAVVGCESFPWSITTLSAASPTLPLSIGTTLGLHLYDYRARGSAATTVLNGGADGGVDAFDSLEVTDYYRRSVRALFDDEPLPPYASLAQPGPLSILHLGHPGAASLAADDIYVAGRFSNILHYDRRNFPKIRDSIFSGARLCALASLPYPFSAGNSERRRKGLMSLDQLDAAKAARGRTLVACGEYNTKGSLELYNLTSERRLPGANESDDWMLRNRQTSSQSKLLSVANHGTRLVFSNGSGLLKWFERDGFTEVRRCRIGDSESSRISDGGQQPDTSLFGSMPGSDDLARKLLLTQQGSGSGAVNDNDIVFWTGEKLGLVGFSARAGFTADEFEEEARSAEELEKEKAERDYSEQVRRALQRQAEGVRFVQGLGVWDGM